jgi:N-methylhydantoinase B
MDAVDLEIQWQRLISLLAESALTVIRTAFSKVVSEGGDFGCLLYDRQGRMVAQDSGVSSKLAASPRTVEAALKKYPLDTLNPGDILISNDPWLVCGHLYDVSVIKPLFHHGKLVGLGECFGHLPDVGGSLNNNSREVYEEGVFLPVVRLIEKGRDNQEVWDIIRSNVRVANQLEGDVRAFIAALDSIERRLSSFLDQYQASDLQSLADLIISKSEQATRANIRKNIPPGVYTNTFALDGMDADEPLTIQVAIKVEGDSITVDYTGTSKQSGRAVNCTEVYAYAWSLYAVRCFVSPNIPINTGLFIPIQIKAPLGSILSARHPAPVRMKSSTGTFIPFAIFGAMAKVIPERVLAESGNKCILRCFATGDDGRALAETPHFMGGLGARYSKDGIACMGFPGAGGETPVEMIENSLPVTILHKRLTADSGGPGRFRGGAGQELAIRAEAKAPMTMMVQNMKVDNPAAGYIGGGPGGLGMNRLNGKKLPGKCTVTLNRGDVLEIGIAGGGGMFDPAQRAADAVARDVIDKVLTPAGAKRDYGIKVTKSGALASGKARAKPGRVKNV